MGDTLIRTVPVKLDSDGHTALLSATARAFNAAASWVAEVCWAEGITNTNTAHHRVYGETRRFRKYATVPGSIQSAIAPCACSPDLTSFTISVGCAWPFT